MGASKGKVSVTKMQFSEKLSQLRRKAGLSQEQLADRLGVTRQSVSKWESGTAVPELGKLIALSELFEVSVDYLVTVSYTHLDVYKRQLQIDASLLYGLEDHEGTITNADLQTDTPYNLYKYAGLPPTPIANPGPVSYTHLGWRRAFSPAPPPSTTRRSWRRSDGFAMWL